MRVTSLIKRAEGHSVRLGNITYAFIPPSYACDVTDEAHAERFRQIPEGYAVDTPKPSKPKPTKASRALSEPSHDAAG